MTARTAHLAQNLPRSLGRPHTARLPDPKASSRRPPQRRTFSQSRPSRSQLTSRLHRLNHGLNAHLAGTRLEVLKFAFYISFPIGFMYYFGVNLSDDESSPFREAARDFWPSREMTHRVPFEREEIKEEMERLRRRRLEIRERRLRPEGGEEEDGRREGGRERA